MYGLADSPRYLPGPPQLGRAGLPPAHLLQRARPGLPLRRLASSMATFALAPKPGGIGSDGPGLVRVARHPVEQARRLSRRRSSPGDSVRASWAQIIAASRTAGGSTLHRTSKRRPASGVAFWPGNSQPDTKAGWPGAAHTRNHSRRSGESAGRASQLLPPFLGVAVEPLLLEPGEQCSRLGLPAAFVFDGAGEGQQRLSVNRRMVG
jgi:hypothetical protein